MTSMPRHMVPGTMASWILLPSSSIASTRRCPSIRVTGSTTTRFDMVAPYLSRTLLLFGFADPWRADRTTWRDEVSAHRYAGDHGEGLADLVRGRVDARQRGCRSAVDRTDRCPRNSSSEQPMQPWPEPMGKETPAVPLDVGAGVVGGRPAAPHLVEAPALARSFVVPRFHNWPASKNARR